MWSESSESVSGFTGGDFPCMHTGVHTGKTPLQGNIRGAFDLRGYYGTKKYFKDITGVVILTRLN